MCDARALDKDKPLYFFAKIGYVRRIVAGDGRRLRVISHFGARIRVVSISLAVSALVYVPVACIPRDAPFRRSYACEFHVIRRFGARIRVSATRVRFGRCAVARGRARTSRRRDAA